MDVTDKNWQKYTNAANDFLKKGQKCCAYRFYQSALTEAEKLLMNSYGLDKSTPVITSLIISYQNLFFLLESEDCYIDLSSYLNRASERFSGVLHSPEFPEWVQENCCEDIHKLYESLIYYSQRYPVIYDDCIRNMNYIKDAISFYSKTYQEKGSENEKL